MANAASELYTDESPGLKVDPVVVLVLSLVFIFSVVALHSTSYLETPGERWRRILSSTMLTPDSHRKDHPAVLQLEGEVQAERHASPAADVHVSRGEVKPDVCWRKDCGRGPTAWHWEGFTIIAQDRLPQASAWGLGSGVQYSVRHWETKSRFVGA